MRRLYLNISISNQLFIVFLFFQVSMCSYACETYNNAVKQSAFYSNFLDKNESTDKNFFSVTEHLSIKEVPNDSIALFKNLAITKSNLGNAEEAIAYITKYISATADMSIINDHLFEGISASEPYIKFKSKYTPRFKIISILYLYAGFLGLFLFLVLNVRKTRDRIGTLLVSLFVLFHSIFILHLNLYVANFQFYLPHTLFVSTTFSFLYGPLLYFYFKRMTSNYKFRWIDTLHLIPSVVLFIYILPFYLMTSLEKFNVVFNQTNWLLPGAYVIIVVKVLSLSIYAFLILRMYRANRHKITDKNRAQFCWQRNLITLHIVYLMAYIVYAANITKIIDFSVLFHLQILVMVGVVFYVSYIVYEQPEIFKGKVKLVDPIQFFKYKKSGLTPSYSQELKDALLQLFNEERIYKNNNLSLEFLSQQLGTTRHNTSQVINEHFDMNFFELVNTYRIKEAQEMLQDDKNSNLTIIQIAYEVGFNNKVTFNKSFKKQLSLTPSQYIKSLRA